MSALAPRSLIVALLLAVTIAAQAPAARAAVTPMVNLGTASSYAALSGASIANTASAVGAPRTTLRGDVGVAVAAQPTGFPPGVITGSTNVGNAAAVQAHVDLAAAYAAIVARPGGAPLAGALAGVTVTPGLYTIAGAASNAGTVTIDAGGDQSAVFVFQINGALAFAAGSHVTLTGGAQAARVFWQVNGAGAIGAGSVFAGTMIAMDAIAIGNGTLFNGRALARNGALTMDADEFYSAPPIVTIAGGTSAHVTTMNPTITGRADVVAPALVTVTINGQTLTTVPSGGGWSVTPPTVANGVYTVTATVVDGAMNIGSATQVLTVDTVPPVVRIDGGAIRGTDDATPTITGTSDTAAGSVVTVTIAGQVMTALVQGNGRWNTTPAPIGLGAWAVVASAPDPAGNVGATSQTLRISNPLPTGSAALNVGVATVGTTLRATVRWSRPATATYRWVRSGVAIPGATSAAHRVVVADLGRQLWLVASVAESGRSVQVTTLRVTPRASSTLSLRATSARIRAGNVIVLRGALHAPLPARRIVAVTILQKVGARWVTRRRINARTTSAGTFAVSYRIAVDRRGTWRARAVFAGVAAVRPATSRFASFVAV